MEVQIFNSAENYAHWINHEKDFPIQIISVLAFEGEIVLTYKRI
jgi:hypothetical protein